jgi:hypothetical protein
MQTAPITSVTDVHANDQSSIAAPSYINWTAIAAGSFIAAATLLVLIPFGAAIGLSMTSAKPGEGASASTLSWMAIIWFALMHLYSAGVGAYITGRLRPPVSGGNIDETRFRDGISGLVMWGIGIIVSTLFVLASVMGAAGTVATTASQTLAPIASAAAQSASPAIGIDYVTDMFLRGTAQSGAPANAAARSDGEIRAEIGRMMATSLSTGDVSEDDRRYIAALISQRTGLAEADARSRVNDTIARAKQTRDIAADKAKAVAEATRKTVASAAFWMTVLSLMTGVAAWYFAQLGGQHRDENRYYY